MQLASEVINIAEDAAGIIAIVIFGFAAFRAFTIGRALVNRVYRNRAYFTGAFAIIVIISLLTIPIPATAGKIYFPFLFVFFIMVDSTILAALDTDFFHRNTLRWKHIRLVVYPLFVAFLAYTFLPSNAKNSLPGIVLDVAVAIFLFILVYTTATAVVSARRTPDRPLRRFMALSGLFLFGFLVNTLIFVLISEGFSFFLFVVFAYITYRMAMSLSPVGRVEKEIKG